MSSNQPAFGAMFRELIELAVVDEFNKMEFLELSPFSVDLAHAAPGIGVLGTLPVGAIILVGWRAGRDDSRSQRTA